MATGDALVVGAAGSLIDWSRGGVIAVVFPKTKSASYDAAVNLARQADQYAEQTLGTSLFHLAGFGRSREQVARALAVVRYLRSVKGFQIYAGGSALQEASRVEDVLQCYLEASGCTDPRAHCVVVVDEATLHAVGGGVRVGAMLDRAWHDVLSSATKHRAFPCRHLLHRNFRFQPGHPSSEIDQLQAAAVREGCDWCPNLNTKGCE